VKFIRVGRVYIYRESGVYYKMSLHFATLEKALSMLESGSNAVLGGDDGRRLRDVLAEDFGFDEPGQPDGELVADELLRWDLEDLCGGMC
jgi:hypothetical protein